MTESQRFLNLFQSIESEIKTRYKLNDHKPFSELLLIAEKQNPVIRNNLGFLRNCAEWRNIMSHNPLYPREFGVVPTSELLERLDTILRKLQNVKRLDAFQKKIRFFSRSDKLSDALYYMHANDFSQIVIYQENTKLQLLTVEGITRWLGKQVEEDMICVKDATVGEALSEDMAQTFKIMRRDQLIDDAWSVFAESIENGSPRIYAIIVTQNGLATEKPLAIITPWDVTLHTG